MWKLAVIAVLAAHLAGPLKAAEGDDLYRAGTDSAMNYLAEFGGALRLTLLLQECGLSATANSVGANLPNSVMWFIDGPDANSVPSELRHLAAQITRGYLLGFEVGVRTEFQRQMDDVKLATCNAAAAAAQP